MGGAGVAAKPSGKSVPLQRCEMLLERGESALRIAGAVFAQQAAVLTAPFRALGRARWLFAIGPAVLAP